MHSLTTGLLIIDLICLIISILGAIEFLSFNVETYQKFLKKKNKKRKKIGEMIIIKIFPNLNLI